jgi:hypothetical protein
MSYTTLNDDDNKITQPKSISIELMNHQKTMIHKMLEVEKNGIIQLKDFSLKKYNSYLNIKSNEGHITTNFAILGDKVGSGKTLMIITLLTIKKEIEDRLIEMGGNQYCSLKLKNNCVKLKTNLIIVPHKLIPQWKEAFKKISPSLNVKTICYNKEIDNLVTTKKETKKNWNNQDIVYTYENINPESINEYDVVIIGETMFKRFYLSLFNVKFNRVIIDEADTIKMHKDCQVQFNFLWLITGTPTGLHNSYKPIPFIGKFYKDDSLNISKSLVIKNDDNYVDQSIILPHPKRFKIKCITPKELSIIRHLIPGHILQMINAGNSEQAIKTLNCNVDTNDNILQVITKNLTDSIINKKREIEFEKGKIVIGDLLKEKEQRVNFLTNQLTKLNEKYENIKSKIYQLNDEYCPVCMDEFNNPTLVSCCNNTFCFDCLAVSLGELKNNKCPYCRQSISSENMHVISKEKVIKNIIMEDEKYKIKDKLDVLIELVQNKKDGSFMIFANYAETFRKIEAKLMELNISYHILKGHSSTVKKYIDDFREKKVNILMLNAQYFGAGMNLQMTTDIIMYHRFDKEMEEQIIGRAQRLGRTVDKPLNVYYLLHDNESESFEDKFKFDDITNTHYIDWLDKENNKNNQNNKDFYSIKMISETSDVPSDTSDTSDIEKISNINLNTSNNETINIPGKKKNIEIINDNDNIIDSVNKNIFLKNNDDKTNFLDLDNFEILS